MAQPTTPERLAERPVDPEHGVPVPFVGEYDDGTRSVGGLNRKRAARCALSRICGLCGRSLEWPVAFLGPLGEARNNAFRFPPLHEDCAEAASRIYLPLAAPVLGQSTRVREWVMVTTGGFEVERPASRGSDQRIVFHPNSISSERRIDLG